MATFLRLSLPGRVVLTRLSQNHRTTDLVRCVSTGRDVTKVTENSIDKSDELKVLEKHFADSDPNKLKNWVTEKFHFTDRDTDRFMSNITYFCMVSIMVVGLQFVIYYMPDHHMRDWATREAYLELYKREKEGLPLIDPYVIPPDQVVLPTEEELGDTEIVI